MDTQLLENFLVEKGGIVGQPNLSSVSCKTVVLQPMRKSTQTISATSAGQ